MDLTRRTVLASTLALPALRSARAASAVLRIGIGTSLTNLDPMKTTIGDEYIYDNLVFNGLTRMAADLSTQPDLAESWTYSDDLKRWTFKLRHGVKFHDGQEMTSAGVVALYKRLPDPTTAAPPRSN